MKPLALVFLFCALASQNSFGQAVPFSSDGRVPSLAQFLAALRAPESPLRLSLLRGDYRIALVIR